MIQFRKRFPDGETLLLPEVPEWMGPLLRARGIDTPEKVQRYLHPGLADLYDAGRMQDMDKALALIRHAVSQGDRILVYGDYDVDGVCACTILLETLREEGAFADFRIPSRHHEGYGLNLNAVEEIAQTYRMLITVDCGISNKEEVRRAKELGMTVIVTDHHELPEELPPADATIHPLLGEYPFRRLCGAGVALKICQALQGMEGVEKRLDIVALATVADIVPLTDENRVIVREGLLRMPDTSRPGLRALMANAQVKAPLRADDIGYRLGPRINAAGRLEDASLGVRLLMTRDEAEAGEIAARLEENNRERQETERKILSESMALFPAQADLRTDRVILIEGENWNSGLIGLVAGKLCERFHHPAIVLCRQGENAVGSCRSIPGVNIYEMLCLCRDLLVRFGGHEQAAGLTVPVDNIPEFRKRLNRVIRENCDDRCFIPVKEYDGELPLRDVTLETIQRLSEMEPTGYGNPAPVFLARDVSVQELRRVGRDGNHLRLTLLEDGTVRSGIGFGLGSEADEGYTRADILFRPERNEYNGRVIPQLQVEAIQAARLREEGALPDPSGEDRQLFLGCLQEMSRLAAKQAECSENAAGIRPEYLLKERFGEIRMTVDELREIYIRFVRLSEIGTVSSSAELADRTGQTEDRLLTALVAFSEIGLLTWQPDPFGIRLTEHPGKRPVTNSPLVRYLWSRDSAGNAVPAEG